MRLYQPSPTPRFVRELAHQKSSQLLKCNDTAAVAAQPCDGAHSWQEAMERGWEELGQEHDPVHRALLCGTDLEKGCIDARQMLRHLLYGKDHMVATPRNKTRAKKKLGAVQQPQPVCLPDILPATSESASCRLEKAFSDIDAGGKDQDTDAHTRWRQLKRVVMTKHVRARRTRKGAKPRPVGAMPRKRCYLRGDYLRFPQVVAIPEKQPAHTFVTTLPPIPGAA